MDQTLVLATIHYINKDREGYSWYFYRGFDDRKRLSCEIFFISIASSNSSSGRNIEARNRCYFSFLWIWLCKCTHALQIQKVIGANSQRRRKRTKVFSVCGYIQPGSNTWRNTNYPCQWTYHIVEQINTTKTGYWVKICPSFYVLTFF